MSERPRKRIECESCGYETVCTELDVETAASVLATGERWLCDLCSDTMTSRWMRRPDMHPEAHTMATICYVGNAILDALSVRADRAPKKPTDGT